MTPGTQLLARIKLREAERQRASQGQCREACHAVPLLPFLYTAMIPGRDSEAAGIAGQDLQA